jgi:hypothetical protein
MIVVTSLHDQKYEPLAEWTLHKNKKPYCEKHGYILHYDTDGGERVIGMPVVAQARPPIPDGHYPLGWGKIFLMKEAMDKYPDAEWIFNADCDVMITNPDIKLEDIIKDYAGPTTHILVPSDHHGINCGVMMIRNSPIGRAFLDTVIVGMPLYKHWYLYENQLIQDMLIGKYLWDGTYKPGGSCWSEVSNVLRQRVMNSYDYKNLPLFGGDIDYKDIWGESGQWQEGDFVIQWPATDLEYRIKAAKELHATLSI